ncbi:MULTISPECIES: hypothetical protein [Actinomyces]|jgi:hypothetical protein avisC_06634|uniref:hypothetical protein n=1 Tax=Actinomyces TaxID=1654 RepID=UPI000C787DF8|nr:MULTISPECIES: hypothetical protein [Actinomyces]PKY74514.1 hypothetical protein CYJ23_07775 [Actinomyces oris]QQQ59213.1 hypothetical protein JJJ14_12200 [Actinomyces sp. HMT 175]
MTDSPTPSTPQPLLSASSYCALIAADTAEAATLRRLIADSQGTTLAIDTSPQDAVELRTDPASPQAPAEQVAPIETASRDWLLRTDDSSHGLADGVTSILLPAGTITEPTDKEREQLIEQAADLLPPDGQLIVSAQHVVGNGLLSETWRLPDGCLITENADPASGLRTVTMRQAGHWSTLTLHLVTPAWLAEAIKRHSMRLTFQYSEPHPILTRHRIVIVRSVKTA